MKFAPEPRDVFEAISKLKDELSVNVELASPDQFIPALPGWENRSVFIRKSFEEIKPGLKRFPAIEEDVLASSINRFFGDGN